ncbi:MAG: PAS domain S-box protein, partial [Atribacterota bacterium]|nr:PAS domain S-box protein [Atribacterota bacterium]
NYVSAKLKKYFIGKELLTNGRIEFCFKDKEENWRYLQSAVNIVGNQLLLVTRDITDQKKAEEALQKSQQEFASLFKSNPEALIYLDEKGIILDANLRFCKLFGYTLKEIRGRNIDDGIIHPSDKIEEGKKLSLKGLEGYLNYETIRKKKDGSLFPVSISATPLTIDGQAKGEIGIYIDITERTQSRKILQESEAKYCSIFELTGTASLIIEEDMTISMVNSQFEKLSGYSKEEVEGKKNWSEFVVKEDLERMKKYHSQRRINPANVPVNYEFLFKGRNGKIKDIFLTIGMISKTKQSIASLLDITERKKNERLKQVLYNISQAANSFTSLDQLYKTIHKELSTIIDTTNFYIALVDEKEDKIFFPYNIDNTKPIHLPRTINHNSLIAQVIKTGKSTFVNLEMIKEKGFITEFKEWFGMLRKVWLGVPLKLEDKTIGAMVVQSYTDPNLYSEEDIKFMEFVSSQVAIAIERKRSEERIKKLSFHDALTGLYNRAYFEEELERHNFLRCYPLSVVMLDVNGLKVVNDTFGHPEGDRLLKHLSQILVSISRQGDILARIGGDEFVILLPSTTSEDAHNFCERIKRVCRQDKIKPIYLKPTISLGHTTQKGEYKDVNSLLKSADRNMYQDKLFNGKSREKHFLLVFRTILAERDPHTSDHAERLQELAMSLGERVGLSEYQLGNLKLLALLHDMGKIGIPDSILFKTYVLTPSEWKKMREHSRIGYRMAKNIPDFASIAQEILYHHERWDGTGYPDGLKGEKIPLLSRIISIVDTFDVMQSRRPYKGPINKTKALKEIKRCAGTQFDPQLLEIFLRIVKT